MEPCCDHAKKSVIEAQMHNPFKSIYLFLSFHLDTNHNKEIKFSYVDEDGA